MAELLFFFSLQGGGNQREWCAHTKQQPAHVELDFIKGLGFYCGVKCFIRVSNLLILRGRSRDINMLERQRKIVSKVMNVVFVEIHVRFTNVENAVIS